MSDVNLDDFGTNVPSEDIKLTEDCCIDSPESMVEDILAKIDSNSNSKSMKLTQWAISGPNTYLAVSDTISKLNPGVYNIKMKQGKANFHIKDIQIDDLIKFPDSQSDKITKEITSFWKKGKVFKEFGFLHRRGYLLYGPQGSGKTAIVNQIISDIIKQGGIVFTCDDPCILEIGLDDFRSIEKNRPVVCLFEDIDAIVKKHGDDQLLSLLDGETQIDKVLNIATTNFPEVLDKRLVSRPRRFDRVIKIGMPNNEIRKLYFEKKLNIKPEEIDKWVKSTDGFSFAACAELVISVKCLDKKFEDAVSILKNLANNKKSSSEFDDKIGFKTNKPGFAGLISDSVEENEI